MSEIDIVAVLKFGNKWVDRNCDVANQRWQCHVEMSLKLGVGCSSETRAKVHGSHYKYQLFPVLDVNDDDEYGYAPAAEMKN